MDTKRAACIGRQLFLFVRFQPDFATKWFAGSPCFQPDISSSQFAGAVVFNQIFHPNRSATYATGMIFNLKIHLPVYTDRYVTKVLKSFGDRILSVPDTGTGEKVLYLKGTAAEYERSRDYQPTAALAGFVNDMKNQLRYQTRYGTRNRLPYGSVLEDMQSCAKLLIDFCPTTSMSDTPDRAEGLSLLAREPFLPVVIAGDGGSGSEPLYDTCVSVERGELLPLCPPWMNNVMYGRYYLNRGTFETDLTSYLKKIWPDLTGRTEDEIRAMCDGQELEETLEFREHLKKELADYDLYWEDCIILRPASKNPE